MEHERSRVRMAGAAFGAWIFFSALWTLLNLVYNPGAELGSMIVVGLVAMGNAGVLAIGVWWLTGQLAWPRDRMGPFLLAHLLGAGAFGFLWIAMGLAVSSVRTGRNLFENPGATQLLGWRMLMGLFLYGLIAGVSYAVRIQRRLADQERLAAEARALAAEARLQGLRSQLHPHFLFNALHTVSALVTRDPERAKLAVQQLGDLLRYSLDEEGARGVVPLEREWAFTRDYLELERLRLGARLQLDVAIEPDARAALVPPFSVQTLVENAIRHAVGPRTEPTRVRVEGRLVDGRLRVQVDDDGPGPGAGATRGPGIGLVLLEKRLDAAFDGDADVRTGAGPDGGYRARFSVPASSAGIRETPEPAEAP